ncbi:MAG: hypothetical protein ABTQ29_13705 [Siculibacillus sp.]
MLKIAYASFGREPPTDVAGPSLVALRVLSTAFVVAGLAATVALNFFSLFAGVLILFVGRPGVEFRFLRLFGRIPVIAFALPILFGFAIWHESVLHGRWHAVVPIASVWILGAVSIAVAALWGWLTRNWNGTPPR